MRCNMTAIYVNEVPTKPGDCPFARKEIDGVLRDIETNKPIPINTYYCNINNKYCDLFCNGKCNKLLKPFLGY